MLPGLTPHTFLVLSSQLAEDLADPKGRSVLKLTHVVIPDKFLKTPDDYSDLEDEEEDEDEDEEDPEAAFEDTTVVLTSLTAGRVRSTLPRRYSQEARSLTACARCPASNPTGRAVAAQPHVQRA